MELIVHILVAVGLFYILYTYVSMRKAYNELFSAYSELELQSFYDVKEYQKLNEELINEVEELKNNFKNAELKEPEVVVPKSVRKKPISKKTPIVK